MKKQTHKKVTEFFVQAFGRNGNSDLLTATIFVTGLAIYGTGIPLISETGITKAIGFTASLTGILILIVSLIHRRISDIYREVKGTRYDFKNRFITSLTVAIAVSIFLVNWLQLISQVWIL